MYYSGGSYYHLYQYHSPVLDVLHLQLSKVIKKVTPFLAFVVLVALVVVGVMSQSYMFRLVMTSGWRIILAAVILPYAGLVIGALLAVLACQPKKSVLTIAVETCVQNANIAMVILKTSLEQPTGDMATIVPMISAAATPLPFVIAIIIKACVQKCRNKGKYDVQEQSGQVKDNSNVMKVYTLESKDINLDQKSEEQLATMY